MPSQPHAALLLPLLLWGPLALPLQHPLQLAGASPWWEQYESQDSYLCRDKSKIVLERNDAQASLISGRYRTTLFREASEAPEVLYRNEQLSVSLRGDELILDQPPRRIVCLRTEQA